ncbi:unnamed protein product [Amaranthus hypochondriacus]
MRVIGMAGDTKIHILIDSGSTHNFLDIAIAKKVRCTSQEIEPQVITVADGNHITCQHKCTRFQWSMNKQNFEGEVLLIPLGGCDMVLGIQWLRTLGQIQWDFDKLLMQFYVNGSVFTLKRIPSKEVLVSEVQPSSKLMVNAAQLCYLQVRELLDEQLVPH